MVVLRLLSWSTLSSTPVTVTVCSVSQVVVVKVKAVGLTVAIAVSPEVTAMVTSLVGAVSSTTV